MSTRGFAATSGAERLGRLLVVGLLIVPLIIGGILAWALARPTSNLDRVTAAIVNDDVPVTQDGQTVPLGRQFAAGLISGGATDAAADNGTPTFTWILTNDDDARAGLADGSYVAVVTIPPTFSADALSIGGPAAAARHASVDVVTTPSSTWLDPALTTAITDASVAALNRQLIARYLGQVYDGFNTIDDQIAQAADGAQSLQGGTDSLATGSAAAAAGAAELAGGLAALDAGTTQLSASLDALDDVVGRLPAATARIAAGSREVSAALRAMSVQLDAATVAAAAVVAEVCRGEGPACEAADAAVARLAEAARQLTVLARGATSVSAGNDALAAITPQIASGTNAATSGAASVAAGAATSNAGATTLTTGTAEVSAGAAQVDAGAAELADGLAEATAQIPTYSDSDITTLSGVVAQPVISSIALPAAGLQSVPLFTVIALWFGALVLVVAVKAVPTRRLLTGSSSLALTRRAVAPVVAVGGAQGLVVGAAVVGSTGAELIVGVWFVGAAVLVGAVFALVNQGLVAVLGAGGRLIALVIGIIALTVGMSSTVPPVLLTIAGMLPTSAARSLLLGILTADVGAAIGSAVLLVIAATFAFLLVFAGVAARRRPRLEASTRDPLGAPAETGLRVSTAVDRAGTGETRLPWRHD